MQVKPIWLSDVTFASTWVFTADGRIRNAVKAYAQDKHKHCLKCLSFISKNKDFPFLVKRKVLLSALMSSILYGTEFWLTENLSAVNPLYLMSIKALLERLPTWWKESEGYGVFVLFIYIT